MLKRFGLLLLMGCALAHAVQVVDDRGVTVTFSQPPQRIVSLLPSLTETVCELGQCSRLVGVDRNSDYPASVRSLAKVGGGLDPNIEAVVALKPDLVLLASSARASERFEALGLKVLTLEPKTHADVRRVLETLGQVLQVDDAQRVWRVIDASVMAAAQSMPSTIKSTRVYFEVSPAPHGAGVASFMGETLSRLGATNIVPASMGPFPKLNPEFVVTANPTLIMVSGRNLAGMAERPGWSHIAAIKNKQVCVFTTEQNDVLVRPGPRMAHGARLMAQCLQGKLIQAP